MTYTPAEKRAAAEGDAQVLLSLMDMGLLSHTNRHIVLELIKKLQAIAADYAERDLDDGDAG